MNTVEETQTDIPVIENTDTVNREPDAPVVNTQHTDDASERIQPEVTSTTLSPVHVTASRRMAPAVSGSGADQHRKSWWSGLVLGASWGLALSAFGIAFYLIMILQPFLNEYFKEFDIKDSFKELFVDLGMLFTSPGYGYTEAREDIQLFLDGTLVDIGWYFIKGGVALIIGGTSLSVYLHRQACERTE